MALVHTSRHGFASECEKSSESGDVDRNLAHCKLGIVLQGKSFKRLNGDTGRGEGKVLTKHSRPVCHPSQCL